jgi:hypothetical protein
MPNIKTKRSERNKKIRCYKDIFGGSVMKFNIVVMENRLD